MSDEQNETKKQNKVPKISMKMTKDEAAHWKELGVKYGFPKLSQLIRRALSVVEHNPSLLSPIASVSDKLSPESQKIYDSFADSYDLLDEKLKPIDDIIKRLETLERFQEWTVEKLGASKKEVKKLKRENYDETGEAVFQ